MFVDIVSGRHQGGDGRWIQIPERIGALLWKAQLFKAQGHKYVKRVPYTDNRGRRRYRYFYKIQHGGGVAGEHHFEAGAAFKYKDGHYHIASVKGDKVEVVHDETGQTKTITKDKLSNLLHAAHAEDISSHAAKLQREYNEAMKNGKPKLAARIKAEAERMGLTLAEIEQRREAGKKGKGRKAEEPEKPERVPQYRDEGIARHRKMTRAFNALQKKAKALKGGDVPASAKMALTEVLSYSWPDQATLDRKEKILANAQEAFKRAQSAIGEKPAEKPAEKPEPKLAPLERADLTKLVDNVETVARLIGNRLVSQFRAAGSSAFAAGEKALRGGRFEPQVENMKQDLRTIAQILKVHDKQPGFSDNPDVRKLRDQLAILGVVTKQAVEKYKPAEKLAPKPKVVAVKPEEALAQLDPNKRPAKPPVPHSTGNLDTDARAFIREVEDITRGRHNDASVALRAEAMFHQALLAGKSLKEARDVWNHQIGGSGVKMPVSEVEKNAQRFGLLPGGEKPEKGEHPPIASPIDELERISFDQMRRAHGGHGNPMVPHHTPDESYVKHVLDAVVQEAGRKGKKGKARKAISNFLSRSRELHNKADRSKRADVRDAAIHASRIRDHAYAALAAARDIRTGSVEPMSDDHKARAQKAQKERDEQRAELVKRSHRMSGNPFVGQKGVMYDHMAEVQQRAEQYLKEHKPMLDQGRVELEEIAGMRFGNVNMTVDDLREAVNEMNELMREATQQLKAAGKLGGKPKAEPKVRAKTVTEVRAETTPPTATAKKIANAAEQGLKRARREGMGFHGTKYGHKDISIGGVRARVQLGDDAGEKVHNVKLTELPHVGSFKTVDEAAQYVAQLHGQLETKHTEGDATKSKHTHVGLKEQHKDVLARHKEHEEHARKVASAISTVAPRHGTKKRAYLEDRAEAYYAGKKFEPVKYKHGSLGRSTRYPERDPWHHVKRNLPEKPDAMKPSKDAVAEAQALEEVAKHTRVGHFKRNIGEHLGIKPEGKVWSEVAKTHAHYDEAAPIDRLVSDYTDRSEREMREAEGYNKPTSDPSYGVTPHGGDAAGLLHKVDRVMAGVDKGEGGKSHAKHVVDALRDSMIAAQNEAEHKRIADNYRKHAEEQQRYSDKHAEHHKSAKELHEALKRKPETIKHIKGAAPHDIVGNLADTAEQHRIYAGQYADMAKEANRKAKHHDELAGKAGPQAAVGAGIAELREAAKAGRTSAARALETLEKHAPEVIAGKAHTVEVAEAEQKLPLPKPPAHKLDWQHKQTLKPSQAPEKDVEASRAGSWSVHKAHGKDEKGWRISHHESGAEMQREFGTKNEAMHGVAMLHKHGVGELKHKAGDDIPKDKLDKMERAIRETREEADKGASAIWRVHAVREKRDKLQSKIDKASKATKKATEKSIAKDNAKVKPKAHTRETGFNRAKQFASDDATRMNLNGVHISEDGATATATDGHRLVRIPLDPSKVPPEDRGQIHHKSENRTIEDTYPDVQRVIPTARPEHEVQFHGDGLRAISDAALAGGGYGGTPSDQEKAKKLPLVVLERRGGKVHAEALGRDPDEYGLVSVGKLGAASHGSGHAKADDLRIGVNAAYFKDALTNIKGHPTIQLPESPDGPVKITRPDGEVHIVMPMRL